MSVIDQVTSGKGDNPDGKADGLFDQLVGDGKRYASNEQLAKGRVEADVYIDRLEGENKEMRDLLDKAEKAAERGATVDDLLAEVRNKTSSEGDNQSPSSEVDIQAIVDKALQTDKRNDKAQTNLSKVDAAVRAKFNSDDSGAAYVAEVSNRLGLSKEDITTLSENSPDAFIAMLNLEPGQTGSPPNFYESTQVNSSTFEAQKTGVRNKDYYTQVRKEMGTQKFYADHKLQKQKFDDANEQGDSFFE